LPDRRARRRIGRRLVAVASALLLAAIMILAYATFLGGSGAGGASQGQSAQPQAPASTPCGSLWGNASFNATVLPSNPSVEFALTTRSTGNGWSVVVAVTNSGSTAVDLPWLASDGLNLVVYNTIGAVAGRTTLKASRVPILKPGDTLILKAGIRPSPGLPMPVYVAVFNPSEAVSLGSWLVDPSQFTVACGAYTARLGGATLLARWLETRYGLVVAEAAVASRAHSTVEGGGSHAFNLTVEDQAGDVVATLAGARLNGTVALPPNSTLVLGAIATYTLGAPYRANLSLTVTLDGAKPSGYDGPFANVWRSGERVWSSSSAVISNGSVTAIVDYSYNGYILAVRDARIVAAENTTIRLNSTFPIRLFGTPIPGVEIRVEAPGLRGGSVQYALLRLGSAYGVVLTGGSNGSYTYSIREGSYTLMKLIDRSGVTSAGEQYTIFYAPRQSNPKLVIVAPWGSRSLPLGSG